MFPLEELLRPYNPWREEGAAAFTNLDVPDFRRPIFHDLLRDLDALPQMISITGPRRIGKSTLLHQVIQHLHVKGIPPDRLVYYSMDDPALFRQKIDAGHVLDDLLQSLGRRGREQEVYLFLDEIQRCEGWELYLKKYYDLKVPVRIMVSGSASSPLLKKSRESLLGRIKDYHLLPFSYREFLLYRYRSDSRVMEAVHSLREFGEWVMGLLTDPTRSAPEPPKSPPLGQFAEVAEQALAAYMLEGGFPEVWRFSSWEAKLDYLYDNQVKKVIYEDLVLAAEFRKPEQLKRFCISLLERPGREASLTTIAQEAGVDVRQVDKYLPLLEMTDLVYRLPRFRKSALRVRRGLAKFYLVDLALRNAVLRIQQDSLRDPEILGLYAENLVFLALKRWRGAIGLDYYRAQGAEVDFIVHLGPNKYLPVEAKYRDHIRERDIKPLVSFAKRFKCPASLVVTKHTFQATTPGQPLFLPLSLFLLEFG